MADQQQQQQQQQNKLSPLIMKDQQSSSAINHQKNSSPTVRGPSPKPSAQPATTGTQLPPFSSLPPMFYFPPSAIAPAALPSLMARPAIQSLQSIAPQPPQPEAPKAAADKVPKFEAQMETEVETDDVDNSTTTEKTKSVSFQQKRGRVSPTKAPITHLTDRQLVWAKQGIKSPHWPAQLLLHPASLECTKLMPKPREDYLLVHLFGTHEYHYVSPNNISAFSALDTEKLKKSRSNAFILGVKEVLSVVAGNPYPEDWEKDDTRFVQSALDRMKQTRPEAVHHAEESSRLLAMGLIVEHTGGFKPMKRFGNDLKARKRRAYLTGVMQRLALCQPNTELL